MEWDLILALQGTGANTSLQLETNLRFALSVITEPHLSGDFDNIDKKQKYFD